MRKIFIVVSLGILISILFPKLIVPILLFVSCLLFMVRFGQFTALDVDPLPFFTLIMFHLYGIMPSFYFVVISLPIIDAFASRLNQYSVINFISILLTLILFYFLPLNALTYGILFFNFLRIAISPVFGIPLNNGLFSVIHAGIYFTAASLVSFFI